MQALRAAMISAVRGFSRTSGSSVTWQVIAGGFLLAAIGCGGSTTVPTAAVAAPHAEITDAAGDAIADARVPVAPDLVGATVDVTGGSITFVIRLAAGTFNRQTTRISVLLDTDQNPANGLPQPDGLGADYGIDVSAAASQATITRADPVACDAHLSCFNPIGTVPVTLLTDGLQVSVPLSMLGNDDGRMSFQVSSYVLVAALTPVVFDYMPENRLSPARVQ